MKSAFPRAGRLLTLVGCFLYFDVNFAVWVLLGPLAVLIAQDLHLDAGQRGITLATPVLAGAALRFVNGILVWNWSFLQIYFHDQYALPAVTAGYFTVACVFMGSLARPMGGALADRIGGTRALSYICALAAALLLIVGPGVLPANAPLATLMIGMAALGTGNGAVLRLVPQRFGSDVGLMTGLLGMTAGVGGFCLAASLGYAKQFTGSYGVGFTLFAVLAMAAWAGIVGVRMRWRQDAAAFADVRV